MRLAEPFVWLAPFVLACSQNPSSSESARIDGEDASPLEDDAGDQDGGKAGSIVQSTDASKPPPLPREDSGQPASTLENEAPIPVLELSRANPRHYLRLEGSGSRLPARSPSCLRGGHTALLRLDLRSLSTATQLNLSVLAQHAPSAALLAGTEEDPALVACFSESRAEGRSVSLLQELDPGMYTLAIATSKLDSLSLHAELPEWSRSAACGETLILPNRSFSIASGKEGCNFNDPTCPDRPKEPWFYEMDLSTEKAETYWSLEAKKFPAGPEGSSNPEIELRRLDTSACGPLLAKGESFGVLLGRGRYVLVSENGPAVVVASKKQLECPEVVNDGCERAILLPDFEGTHQVSGNTACATPANNEERDEHNLKLFYRLDLSRKTSGTLIGSDLDREWFEANPDGSCGEPLEGRLTRAPREYVVTVRHSSGSGPFVHDFTAETDGIVAPATCVDSSLAGCGNSSEADCKHGLNHPNCVQTLVECGLAASALFPACKQRPECCEGTEVSPGCNELFESTGAVCRECLRLNACGLGE